MPLHVVVKVRCSFIDELVIARITKPPVAIMPEPLSCAAHDDAPVCSWDEVVIVSRVKANAVGVDQVWRILAFRTFNVTGGSANGHYHVSVFGKDSSCIPVSCVHDFGSFDGAPGCIESPSSSTVLSR